jgi:putative ABC transport system substrate-binding protein
VIEIALLALGAMAVLCPPFGAYAQPPRTHRLGYLDSGWPTLESKRALSAFRTRLSELGYREVEHYTIEYRWAEGNYERLPQLAAELAAAKVDVIIAGVAQAARAAKQATNRIPIVMVGAVDPLGFGLVKQHARPGENVTGLSNLSAELTGKQLEFLTETVPGVFRVAVLWNAANPAEARLWRARHAAAKALGVVLTPFEIRNASDIGPALAGILKAQPQALHLVSDPLLIGHRESIIKFAAANRIPVVSDVSEFTEAGALMSYGAHLDDLYRGAARYVDKILKGARASTLPIEQPTQFELVINLKTARALGITIPPRVLVFADRVIQ